MSLTKAEENVKTKYHLPLRLGEYRVANHRLSILGSTCPTLTVLLMARAPPESRLVAPIKMQQSTPLVIT
jgi:hypothetical protein